VWRFGALPVLKLRPRKQVMSDADTLLEKLRALPPDQLREVEDFVDFLAAKARRRAAMDRLLSIAPGLEESGVTPVSESDVQAEIDAVRVARRARGSVATGS
jgi:hypothetical protein